MQKLVALPSVRLISKNTEFHEKDYRFERGARRKLSEDENNLREFAEKVEARESNVGK